MAFDGIVTKAITDELQEVRGARMDKVFQPNKNTIYLGFYLSGTNYLLNICIDPQNYRMHLTTNPKPNPKIAPNFCMVLRKHLLGLHIKNIITNHLERLVLIEFEGLDDIDDVISKKLVIELMGKHCNVILLDDQNIIIDSMRHINSENSTRSIVPHAKYEYPAITKEDFLECLEFKDFNQLLKDSEIYETFNGISKSFVFSCMEELGITAVDENLYCHIQKIVQQADSQFLNFSINKKGDYYLRLDDKNNKPFHLNFFLDDFYYKKETTSDFKNYRDSILKMILSLLKKYQKRLKNMDEKLRDCEDRDKYQLYGELITANLYKIKNENQKEIVLDNYYTNSKITIPLDNRYSPAVNAKMYFKKYHKLKNALSIVSEQKQETIKELNYIESIIYELENCTTIEEVSEIFEEISENVIFQEETKRTKKQKKSNIKKSSFTKNKTVSFNPIKYTIDGYTLLVGRNNKENDYLSLKYAKKTDIWLHTKDIPSGHAILELSSNPIPDEDLLIKCAKIVASHSKAKLSSNVPVDFCEVKYVKKPNGAKPRNGNIHSSKNFICRSLKPQRRRKKSHQDNFFLRPQNLFSPQNPSLKLCPEY